MRLMMRLLALALTFWCWYAPAQAGSAPKSFEHYQQIAQLGQIPSFVVPPPSASFSITFESSALTTNTGSVTVDYGTLSYGSGCTRVVVANLWYTGGTISGITVGGNSLAQITGAHVAANGVAADIWESGAALSGSSGDVQVTYSSAQAFVGSVALYCLVTTTPASSAQATTTFNALGTPNVSLSIPSGGGGIALTTADFGTTVTSFTNASTDTDEASGGANQYYAHTTATGSVAVTANYASSGDNGVLSVVAWGP